MSAAAFTHADSSDRPFSFFEQLYRSDKHFHQVCDWGLYLGDAVGAADWKSLQAAQITRIVTCHPGIPLSFEGKQIVAERSRLPQSVQWKMRDGGRYRDEKAIPVSGVTDQWTDGQVYYHRCEVLDTPLFELKPHYEPALKFIRESYLNGQNVLIHCQKGISRSSALVIAYVMRFGWGHVDRIRDITVTEPNPRRESCRGSGRDSGSERHPYLRPFTYEEIFPTIEKRRNTAFPNVGFQEQLVRYFENQDRGDPLKGYHFDKASIVKTIKHQILERFDECERRVNETLESGGTYKELGGNSTVKWKKPGLFFENCHKYEFVDEFVRDLKKKKSGEERGRDSGNSNGHLEDDKFSVPSVVKRGVEICKLLKGMGNVFSPTMEVVRMGKGLASEIEKWLSMLQSEYTMQLAIKRKRDASEERRKQADEEREAKKREKEDAKRKEKEDKEREKDERKAEERRAKYEGYRGSMDAKERHKGLLEMDTKNESLDERLRRLKAELAGVKSTPLPGSRYSGGAEGARGSSGGVKPDESKDWDNRSRSLSLDSGKGKKDKKADKKDKKKDKKAEKRRRSASLDSDVDDSDSDSESGGKKKKSKKDKKKKSKKSKKDKKKRKRGSSSDGSDSD